MVFFRGSVRSARSLRGPCAVCCGAVLGCLGLPRPRGSLPCVSVWRYASTPVAGVAVGARNMRRAFCLPLRASRVCLYASITLCKAKALSRSCESLRTPDCCHLYASGSAATITAAGSSARQRGEHTQLGAPESALRRRRRSARYPVERCGETAVGAAHI